MTPQQRMAELEWSKWRKKLTGEFFRRPTWKELRRVTILAVLTFSLMYNLGQANVIDALEAKLNEINEIAKMQNGWVWFDTTHQ